MGKVSLQPLNALGGAGPVRVVIGAVQITENAGIALASLATRRGRSADVASAATALGLSLPGPGKASATRPFSALWLGPDQWMVMADASRHEDIVADLIGAFGAAASITEQTGGWVCLDITSPDLPALFERLCPVDMAVLTPGCGTRTMIEHLGCYVIRLDPQGVRLFGPRSSAGSLLHALKAAALSIA